MKHRISKKLSTLTLAIIMMASAFMTLGEYIPSPQSVFAASNASKFSWAYTGSGVDGRANQMFHSLNKGKAQIKVEKCAGYTKSAKATVTLRKTSKKYPYYTNCGSITFYGKGTYTFGSVEKSSYWLYVSGKGNPKKTKSASGKVQNK